MTLTPRKIARYGWQRDSVDPRDRIFNLEHRIEKGVNLPVAASLELEMPAVFDQGRVGSCTANADVAVVEHAARAAGDRTPLSRLGLYADERIAEGQSVPLQDTGAQVRTGIRIAVSHGIGPEADWPYDEQRASERPPAGYYTDARKHEALAYKRILVGPGAPLRSAISQGYPFAFGFPVPEYFENPNWDPAAQPLPLPGQNTTIIGGHAVVAVAYDFSRQRFHEPVFKIRNSWGPDWGEQGHFYMPSSWFSHDETLAGDMWAVTKAN